MNQERAAARNPSLFNPERPQALVSRYQNFLSKGKVDAIRVTYTTRGVEVLAVRPGDDPNDPLSWVTLDVATRREVAASTDQEELDYIRSKFELRFDMECPVGFGNSGASEMIKADIRSLPFKFRKALMLSNQAFEKSYPGGFEDGEPVDDTKARFGQLAEPLLLQYAQHVLVGQEAQNAVDDYRNRIGLMRADAAMRRTAKLAVSQVPVAPSAPAGAGP